MREPGDRDLVLNRDCFCITLDRTSLEKAILDEAQSAGLTPALLEARPHLFSGSPVFISARDLAAMLDVVAAIEAVAEAPRYRDAVLAWAPPIAHRDFGPRGAFMGYDFHLGDAGPKLIEVNTNAGGAFLNAFLARAQTACCREAREQMGEASATDFEGAVWRMFLGEWELQKRTASPRTIAIVDDRPQEQYLYPEFLLAQRLLSRRGLKVWVVDPAELRFSGGRLQGADGAIDLVYNRLVDFAMCTEGHAALREAYLVGAVVVTPNPHNHALLADKRNLTLLSDPSTLQSWGISPGHLQALSAVPRTVLVTAENADELWAARKGFYFKPSGGHGSKAVYRGDKLTRRVWAEIQQGGYIAQEFWAPSERRIKVDGEIRPLKVDVRLYTYRAGLLMAAARVYQGQTTNFRTPGGGFAPVFIV